MRAGPGPRAAAGLAPRAGHRRPVGQHARAVCSISPVADAAPRRRRDRAPPRGRAGSVVRARRRGGAALPAGRRQRPAQLDRGGRPRARRARARGRLRAPTCSHARLSRSTRRTKRPAGSSPASRRCSRTRGETVAGPVPVEPRAAGRSQGSAGRRRRRARSHGPPPPLDRRSPAPSLDRRPAPARIVRAYDAASS